MLFFEGNPLPYPATSLLGFPNFEPNHSKTGNPNCGMEMSMVYIECFLSPKAPLPELKSMVFCTRHQ
jgi:hypothetical protein